MGKWQLRRGGDGRWVGWVGLPVLDGGRGREGGPMLEPLLGGKGMEVSTQKLFIKPSADILLFVQAQPRNKLLLSLACETFLLYTHSANYLFHLLTLSSM